MKTESRLVNETLELLAQCDLSKLEISFRSGVNYHWLNDFVRGKIPNAGVLRVETLHDFLVEHMTGKVTEEA